MPDVKEDKTAHPCAGEREAGTGMSVVKSHHLVPANVLLHQLRVQCRGGRRRRQRCKPQSGIEDPWRTGITAREQSEKS